MGREHCPALVEGTATICAISTMEGPHGNTPGILQYGCWSGKCMGKFSSCPTLTRHGVKQLDNWLAMSNFADVVTDEVKTSLRRVKKFRRESERMARAR